MLQGSTHVICTSAGNQGFPSVLIGLKRNPTVLVTAVDCDPHATGPRLADRNFTLPLRVQTQDLIHELSRLYFDGFQNIILPLSTEDQDFYATHKGELEKNGFVVIVSSQPSLAIANDKHNLMIHARKWGIQVPASEIIEDFNSLERVIAGYTASHRKCVLKLARGTGRQGVKVIDPGIDSTSGFWDTKNLVVGTKVALDFFRRQGLSEPVMVSDFLEGKHLSVDAVMTPDLKFHSAVRTEERQMGGSSLAGETVRSSNLTEIAERLIRKISLTGPMNIEFILNEAGEPCLIEINPRFGASIGHTISAGLNLPLILIHSILGIDTIVTEAKSGIAYIPIWIDGNLVYSTSQ